MNFKHLFLLVILFASLTIETLYAGSVSVNTYVSSTEISLGDTIELVIEIEMYSKTNNIKFRFSGIKGFSALNGEGESESDGERKYAKHTITLKAEQKGTLVIPPFTQIDDEGNVCSSEPITINVY